ncbi:hypothetical protein JW796_01205 [Candidatus Dojkabacteria bacterium]|nr:hypothetical protein [Candidatus Dojkabacteria bacterium]
MRAYIEINDSLRLTKAQELPMEIDLKKYKVRPFKADDFGGKVFEFRKKLNARLHKLTPMRNIFCK